MVIRAPLCGLRPHKRSGVDPPLGSGSPAAIRALRAMNSPGLNGSEGRLSEPTGRNAYSGDPKRSEGPPPLRQVLKNTFGTEKVHKTRFFEFLFSFLPGRFSQRSLRLCGGWF